MKKVIGFVLALMLIFSSLAYAGGDKNCGDKGQGLTGSDGGGQTSQKRAGGD